MALLIAMLLVSTQAMENDNFRIDRTVEHQQQTIAKCHAGDESSCDILKVEVAAALVGLGLIVVPEVVALLATRATPRVAATTSAAGASATGAISKFTPAETEALRRLFGQGLAGAKVALQNFNIPQGISPDLLLRYKAIADAYVAAGKDTGGVQALRLQLIKRALEDLSKT